MVRIARRTRRELGGRLWVTGTKTAVTQNTWTRVLKEFNTAATCFGHLMRRVDSLEKTDAGRDWGQEEKGTTEDEMAGWHH